MAIKELIKNKKYQIIISYRDEDDEPRNKKYVFDGTFKDALLEEAVATDNLKNGIDDDITFRRLFDEYIDTKRNSVTKNTIDKEIQIYDKYLSSLSDTKYKFIRYRDLLILKDKIDGIGGALTQKNKAIHIFKRVSKYAFKAHDFVDLSEDITLFRKSAADHKVYTIITPEEFNYIMEFEDIEMYRLIYEVYFWTGLRRGCLLGLFKRDLLESKELDVYNSVNDKGILGPPKNRSSYRKVLIHDELYEKLVPYTKLPGQFLFGDKNSLGPTTINRRFTAAQELANKELEKQGKVTLNHVRVHDLRHSHASWLISQGVPIPAITARLGHSSPFETLNTYAHLFKGDDEKVIHAIDQYISAIKTQKKDN